MNLPTKEECYELFRNYHTPSRVISHSEQVAKVAKFLAEKFNEVGFEVNVDLVYKAGLLHDLLRVVDVLDFANFEHEGTKADFAVWKKQRKDFAGQHHANAAYEALNTLGYSKLAQVVERHKAEAVFDKTPFESLEEKIVYYADKRVAHSKIVSLDERIREAKERYNWSEAKMNRIRLGWQKMRELEKELFAQIDVGPEAIK